MKLQAVFAAALAIAMSAQACFAADPRYPDWPCAQAKVPEISLAAVWAGPPLEDAQKAVTDFLSAPGTDKMAAGKLLFAGLFDTLNAQRSSVMTGLERVTRKQRAAANKIRTDTVALQALQDATPPDQAKIDEL